jgi:hypothetical protein
MLRVHGRREPAAPPQAAEQAENRVFRRSDFERKIFGIFRSKYYAWTELQYA